MTDTFNLSDPPLIILVIYIFLREGGGLIIKLLKNRNGNGKRQVTMDDMRELVSTNAREQVQKQLETQQRAIKDDLKYIREKLDNISGFGTKFGEH